MNQRTKSVQGMRLYSNISVVESKIKLKPGNDFLRTKIYLIVFFFLSVLVLTFPFSLLRPFLKIYFLTYLHEILLGKAGY